jgi:hypothetical protein
MEMLASSFLLAAKTVVAFNRPMHLVSFDYWPIHCYLQKPKAVIVIRVQKICCSQKPSNYLPNPTQQQKTMEKFQR